MNSIIIIYFCYIVLLKIHKCVGVNNGLLPLPTQPKLATLKRPALVPICPAPFYKVYGLQKCYLFVNNGVHFSQAKADCEAKESTLMKIETDDERKWLLTLKPLDIGLWIGAVYYQNGSKFWLDGTPLTILPGCLNAPVLTHFISFPGDSVLCVSKGRAECGNVRDGNGNTFYYVCKRDLLRYI